MTGSARGCRFRWLLALLATCSLLAALPAEGSGKPGRVRPQVYWGAWIGRHLTGTEAPWDMTAVHSFEWRIGKRLSLLMLSQPFYDCYASPCRPYTFPRDAMTAIRSHGAIPVLSWASNSIPVAPGQPDFRLARVAGGQYDDHVRAWARAAKRWGHPFFLRFNWEMNSHCCYPWAELVNGNRQGDYVRAWRHVHDVFRSVGATNATWVWCPNTEYEGSMKPLSSLYPGDAYVDWTCVDAYNWAGLRGGPWMSFGQLLKPTYDLITGRIAPSKPMMIGETASGETGGSKAAWISDMLRRQLRRKFRKVKAFLWFDKYEDGADWPLDTSPWATSAFARGIRSCFYAGNRFRWARSLPIRPLGRLTRKRCHRMVGS